MNRIILPLDGMGWMDASRIIIETAEHVWGFKVNDLLTHMGDIVINEINRIAVNRAGVQTNVMADPKLYDIPNTMRNQLDRLKEADIITVHCSALYHPREEEARKIAGVTVLTSMSKENCEAVFCKSVDAQVSQFSSWCSCHGYGYMVCSANDLRAIEDRRGVLDKELKFITPGIRPLWYQRDDDQERTTTPAEAIKMGADLLVIGRPLLQAKDMVGAIKRTNEEIEEALNGKKT